MRETEGNVGKVEAEVGTREQSILESLQTLRNAECDGETREGWWLHATDVFSFSFSCVIRSICLALAEWDSKETETETET